MTDHGRPVARLVPVTPSSREHLIAEGKITPGRGRKESLREPIVTAGTVSDLVSQQRQ